MFKNLKFRAKGIATNQWYFGYYSVDEEGRPIITATNEYGLVTEITHVDQSTVSIFTGLLDKYKEEIYENDIIRCFDTSGEKVYDTEVELPDFYRSIWSELSEYELCKVAVIGNIFDNKEFFNK